METNVELMKEIEEKEQQEIQKNIDDDLNEIESLEKEPSVIDKVKDFGGRVKFKASGLVDKIKKDPAGAMLNAGAAISLIGSIGAIGFLASAVHKGEREVYSKEVGETVEVKHKLNNKEKTELDYRMSTGQTKIQALNDMNLIK